MTDDRSFFSSAQNESPIIQFRVKKVFFPTRQHIEARDTKMDLLQQGLNKFDAQRPRFEIAGGVPTLMFTQKAVRYVTSLVMIFRLIL